jgi:uncharacterized membrane protein YdjX (TVP38/TMEM64 family)
MLPAMTPTLRRLLFILAILAFVAIVGGWARERLGIALDVESVRSFANGLGPMGPFLFVLVVAGRSLLWLPSQVVLVAAGLCFGTLLGAVVGGAGLMLSGLFLFLVARYAGRDVIEKQLGPRVRGLFDFTGRRRGAIAFALACGYPVSPLSPLHAAAGWTPMSIPNFIASAFAGGMIRAAIFAYFGDGLTDASWSSLAAPLLVLAVSITLPLAFPKGRAWLRDIFSPRPATNSDTD